MTIKTKNLSRAILFGSVIGSGFHVSAHTTHSKTNSGAEGNSVEVQVTETILVDAGAAERLGLQVLLAKDEDGLAVARATPNQLEALSKLMHDKNRCGGFELLPRQTNLGEAESILSNMTSRLMQTKLESQKLARMSFASLQVKPELLKALEHVDPAAQRAWVEKISSFNTRYHSSSDPNGHVDWLIAQLQKISQESHLIINIDRISHRRTEQDSVRVRILGKSRPSEIVALGGHFDSTVGWFSGDRRSPGADDNASGSANILEAFRILSKMDQPERSIEFFWYAAEEIGLVGSAEIAETYKNGNKDVVAVLQLDMTLQAGSGPMVIASMEDFTSPWLREFLVDANRSYNLGISIIADECGYGCSDHASWFRQGYSTLMPFESTFREMNRDIHKVTDTVNQSSHFEHSSTFTKIALIFAGELANSDRRAP